MKLLRYGPIGQEKPGLLDSDCEIRDLSNIIPDIDSTTIQPESLARLQKLDTTILPLVLGNPRIGAPLARVGNLIGIGLNYRDHAEEAGKPVPDSPVVFLKSPHCLSGPFDNVVIPNKAQQVDWEVELGIVIGTKAKNLTGGVEEAANHIAGYCIVHDVTERSYQTTGNAGQWTKGKCCDGFCPAGPCLVTADEIADPQNLNLWLRVNGLPMQESNTSNMIFTCAELVTHVSQYMTLYPGDLIATGTPAGVGMGRKPPRFLMAGDVVQLGIHGLGEQQQTFVDE
jgi:2,4-diketo-3-deoxy-L-fuconate hydrolase